MQTFEYNEAAWNKMEVMLDNDDKNRRIGMWLLLGVGLALATIFGIWYASLDNGDIVKETIYANEDSSISSNEASLTQTETVVLENIASVESQIEPVESTSDIHESIESNETEKIADNNTEVVATDIILAKVAEKDLVASNAILQPKENNIIVIDDATVAPTSSEEIAEEVSQSIAAVNVVEKSNAESKAAINTAHALIQIEALSKQYIASIEAEKIFLQNQQTIIPVAPAENDEESHSVLSKFSYTVFAAQEWSSVGIVGAREMGYKYGLKLGYQVANKWELSTGVSLSQKKFNGDGSEFTISEGWVDDIMPMTMDAKCNIIEIPLDVVYHHSGLGNSGFIASAGLRSFMLHSEWYGFEYDSSQDARPDLLREKNMDNQNKNWLGSLELSAGYNQKVSNNLSVQISPYLQIPVTGFGDGKVNLFSSGVQLAVRFDGK